MNWSGLTLGALASDLDRVLFHQDSIALGRMIGSDALLIACIAFAILSVISLAAMTMARRDREFAERLARLRAKRLNDMMRTVRLAEQIACLGVWQYDPVTGLQQWSHGLRRIFGVDHDEPFREGDAETLLFANDVDLIGAVRQRFDCEGPYSLNFDIFGFDGRARTLSVEACNLNNRDGSPSRVVAVFRDVTEQASQMRELEYSRAEAMREANQARELAETDPLTGLANRRKVMDRLDRMIVEARGLNQSLVMIMFDIDHFKSVNDEYGHVEGDRVLKKVAQIASDQTRDGDVLARVGGEEFVWVVPGAGESVARIMAERLRYSVASESATAQVPAVTISAGFASLRPGDTSISLFGRADAALYEAKGAGRNQVKMAA